MSNREKVMAARNKDAAAHTPLGTKGCKKTEPRKHGGTKKAKKAQPTIGTSKRLAYIDEANDPGSRVHGDKYIMGGAVIDLEHKTAFEDIAKKRQKGKPLKFKDDKGIRNEMIDDISELSPNIYIVSTKKPARRKWDKKEQRNVHRNMAKKVMNKVAKHEDADEIGFVVDRNNRLKSGRLDEIAEEISRKRGKKVTAEIHSSGEDLGLQSNDFVLGAEGRRANNNDTSYSDKLPNIRRSKLMFWKTKP